MPSGKKHDEMWGRCFPWLGIVSILIFIILEFTLVYVYPYSCVGSHCFTNSLLTAIGVPLGYLFGRYITPDLDQSNITKTEWDAMRKAKLFGVFFVMYWLPYGYLMKHRSTLSHSYILSSAIRMVYSFWWILFLHPVNLVLFILFGVFLGLSVSDGIHIFLDMKEK